MEAFQCHKCKSYFATADTLQRHLNEVDCDYNRFKCTVCEKTFSRKYTLQRHVRNLHGTTKTKLPCDICGVTFTRKDSLRHHRRSKHGLQDETHPTPKPDVAGDRQRQIPTQDMDATEREEDLNQGMTSDDDEFVLNEARHLENIQAFQNDTADDDVMTSLAREVDSYTSFIPDPLNMPTGDAPTDPDLADIYRNNWPHIRTHFRRGNPVLDIFNYRINALSELPAYGEGIFNDQVSAYRINMSVGFILRHQESGELRYYHTSVNNHVLFENPYFINNVQTLTVFLRALEDTDILEFSQQQRVDTKWCVELVTNVTFYVTKLQGVPIGAPGDDLPSYILDNRGIYALAGGSHGPYRDSKCLFRCLAISLDGASHMNCETQTNAHLQTYLHDAGMEASKFRGVPLAKLPDIERLFNINIYVYELQNDENIEDSSDEDNSDKPLVFARLLRRSPAKFNRTMYVNLYNRHFSYIHDMRKYSRCYLCEKCNKAFNRRFNLETHQKTCDVATRRKFPGGVFRNTPSVFAELEDEGIVVPEQDRFFPYFAVFDFEAMQVKLNSPDQSAKLQWTTQHVPLSVSLLSNIPGCSQPQTYVNAGDVDVFIQRFLNELEGFSQKSRGLLLDKFENVLAEIDRRIGMNIEPSQPESMLTDPYTDSDDDLMTTPPQCESPQPSMGSDIGEYSIGDFSPFNDSSIGSPCQSNAAPPDSPRPHPLSETASDSQHSISLKDLVNPPVSKSVAYLQKIKSKFIEWCSVLPVLGFNSGRYDINLIKKQLYRHLCQNAQVTYHVKKNNSHMVIATHSLQFLDVRNYLAPNVNYENFVKAYDCQLGKGKFCYTYIDNLDRLKEERLPDRSAFFNDLKNEELSEADYAHLLNIWHTKSMKTLEDFLVWYNELDVIPFREAVEKMFTFYRSMGIDMFKECISIPGLTMRYLFKALPTYFTLISDKDSDIYDTMKKNIVGGPSIVFHRYHEKGVTLIRDEKPCEAIVGYDANALYLWALAQPMPTREYTRWVPIGNGQFERSGGGMRQATQWLEWEGYRRKVSIRHQGNATEKRVGDRRLPVDGFAIIDGTPTVWQFSGCYWHAHTASSRCTLRPRQDGTRPYNDRSGLSAEQLYQKTLDTAEYIKSLGYNYVEIWECEFYREKINNVELRNFLRQFEKPLDRHKILKTEDIIRAIQDKRLFGLVECDIRVPTDRREQFADFPPIFKNTDVGREDIGEFMKAYAEEEALLPRPRRTLVSSMFGEKILLGTPLLHWYLTHGLEITQIYQVIEFTPDACFEDFAEEVTRARRLGDSDPKKKILGDTFKLLGNSGYGRTITDKSRHTNVKLCDDKKVHRLINTPHFRSVDEVDEGVYEVTSRKRTIRHDLPVQIGFIVYQYAKLKMLQFVYDFLYKFLDRSDFQILYTDTDSLYLALAGESIEQLIRPSLKGVFEMERGMWFPRPTHMDIDKREPGLFKTEYEGDGFIGLTSKTYYCFGTDSDKFSCKGVSRRSKSINKELYLSVLKTKQTAKGCNKGTRVFRNTMRSYTQVKDAFAYLYTKRKVLADGISTTYLDV